jgi:hypothetical protein
MADQMKPTPRSTILGLFSDVVNLPLQYMSAPERTQQSQGAAQFLYGTGIPQTLERMSYGDSLFTGAGGLGGTTRMRPETADALMNVAPMAKPAAVMATRAVRATEGLPVGMSIKDVGKSAITREGNPIQSAVVLVGDKIFMGRTHGDALNRAVYEGVVRKEGGKYIYPKGAEVNSDLFMTKDGQILNRFQALKMFDIGASETAIEKGLMQNNPPKSMTVDSYIEQATALKKQREQSPYPQQAALDLAQQRAALPVEQGGLGLPANNTAADRAKAMGFDVEAYHGTASTDIQKFMPEGGTPEGEKTLEWYKNRQAQNAPVGYMSFRSGSFFSPKPDYAGNYAPETTGVMYPVNLRMDNPLSLLPNAQGRYSATNAPDINKTIDAMILQDSIDKSINEIAIIDPAQIRSRFAAFDPFRKDVATATAMGVALPDLLAQPVNRYELPQETTPMYTDPFGNTIGSSIR